MSVPISLCVKDTGMLSLWSIYECIMGRVGVQKNLHVRFDLTITYLTKISYLTFKFFNISNAQCHMCLVAVVEENTKHLQHYRWLVLFKGRLLGACTDGYP